MGEYNYQYGRRAVSVPRCGTLMDLCLTSEVKHGPKDLAEVEHRHT